MGGRRGPGEGEQAIDSSRSSAIIHTALMVAKDIWRLNDFRLKRMAANRIVNQGVTKLHNQAKEYIEKAEAALAAKDYEALDTFSRAA